MCFLFILASFSVTGGGTGLGAAVCELYAQEGMNLAIGYSRSSTDAEGLAKRLSETYGIKAYTVQADFSKTGVAEKSVDEAYELLGGLDVLVNNAGMTKFCAFDDLNGLQEEDWDNILSVNTRAVFFTSRSALKYFVKNKDGGSIINTTSGKLPNSMKGGKKNGHITESS
jgi:[acyl-carrier-protein] S-malonyltransferase